MLHMIDIPILNNHDIFIYPQEDNYIVYAPLASVIAEASSDEIRLLEQELSASKINDTLAMLLQRDNKIISTISSSKSTELTILLNQRCNFSCSYCYSANGRDTTELSPQQLCDIFDWFIQKQRGDELEIVFSGGGDPLLSFDLLHDAILYAKSLARKEDVLLHIGIVTNGSLVTPEIIDFIQEHAIELVISCDILPDVHNTQRSHFTTVADTLYMLKEYHIPVGIRATITPLNVNRQEEMVHYLHEYFPHIQSAAFEIVLSATLFSTKDELQIFYQNFIKHIFKAQQVGEQYGITIGNTIINNVSSLKERACLGKIVVTPQGIITACSRLSSPKEAYFQDLQYGCVSNGKINIDTIKERTLIDAGCNNYGACKSCIAKYHCSGGCLLARKTLPTEYFTEYCNFMKQMVVECLKINL